MALTPARAPLRLLVPWLLVVAVLVTGCASGSDDSGSASSAGGGADAPTAAEVDRDSAGRGSMTASDVRVESVADDRTEPAVDPADGFRRSVVRTGDLAMRADDIGKARYDVQRIVDRYRGEVTEENTESDEDGDPLFARMVLRVPSDDFDEALAALEKVGEQASVSTKADDVTTKLIDLSTRVQTQRRSIQRITVLFQQAESIRDVMAIEAELSRRQADLEALERKRAYLAGQASMSTITVGIERSPDLQAGAKKTDDDGFLAGFSAGWGALRSFGVGVATVLGALLPWLLVGAALGVPLLLLLRRRSPRVVAATPDGAQAGE